MAIVNNESIEYLKEMRNKAKIARDYESAYRISMEGLCAAIAQLEQLSHITDKFEIEVVHLK